MCPTCNDNAPVVPATQPHAFPLPAAGLAEPLPWVVPNPTLDNCPSPAAVAATVPCNDGYRWQVTSAVFTAPDQCANSTFSAPCADKWAYPGLLVEIVPYGFAEVVSVAGDVVTFRNISLPPTTDIPALSPIRPIPRVRDDPNHWVTGDDVEDVSANSIIFPVLSAATECGVTVYKPGFKRTLCGIPVAQATTGDLNAGAQILIRVAGTNCIKRMPPPAAEMINPFLAWSQSKGCPIWVDGVQPDRIVFLQNGAVQQDFIVPGGYTRMQIKVWGAGGQWFTTGTSSLLRSGGGGYASCIVPVTPGDAYKIIIGVSMGSGFGFCGTSTTTGGVRGNCAGGGLSGIFTGSGAVAVGDFGRAVCIAGGGGGGAFSLNTPPAPATVYDAITAGGDTGASMSNMQGAQSTAGANGGSGGGGYRGGTLRRGGSSFTMGDSQVKIQGVLQYAVQTGNPDYISNTGGQQQPGAVVIIMIP